MKQAATVIVENVNVPGYTARVDAEKYHAVREAILQVTPATPPGLTAKEMLACLAPVLPSHLWPGSEKAGWWQKTVQLDLEAKGLLTRVSTPAPLRWYRTSPRGKSA